MLGTVDWIAVALGCICGVQALVYWRSAQRSKTRHQQSQLDLQQAHGKAEEARLDLQQAQGKADEARRQLQELIAHPPVPTDAQFVSHLSALCTRIVDRILVLDGARLSSAEPLRLAAEESEQSRVVKRKERFATYCDTLRKANIQISLHTERLLDSHSAVLTLRDAIKAGYLNSFVGHPDCMEIEAVVVDLDQEESPDDAWRNAIRNIRKEFDSVLKARDERKELYRLDREADRAAAASAFNKYKLPPMTPLAKFRALVPRGQRDNFD